MAAAAMLAVPQGLKIHVSLVSAPLIFTLPALIPPFSPLELQLSVNDNEVYIPFASVTPCELTSTSFFLENLFFIHHTMDS